MGNGIEVRFEYGGMWLICDEEALVRIRDHICKEASVADAIGRSSEARGVQFIWVTPPVDESAGERLRWFNVIPIILVNCIMIPVWITGFVTVFRWVMRQIA
jgi:hypothetical protein